MQISPWHATDGNCKRICSAERALVLGRLVFVGSAAKSIAQLKNASVPGRADVDECNNDAMRAIIALPDVFALLRCGVVVFVRVASDIPCIPDANKNVRRLAYAHLSCNPLFRVKENSKGAIGFRFDHVC